MVTLLNISRESLSPNDIDRNQIRSSQKRIQEPCQISLRQYLTYYFYFKQLLIRCLAWFWIGIYFSAKQKSILSLHHPSFVLRIQSGI